MSKLLRSRNMKALLAKAERKAGKPPSEGMLRSLGTETALNGWYYQFDHVYDLRIHPKPYVVVFAFAPGHDGVATHHLTSYN